MVLGKKSLETEDVDRILTARKRRNRGKNFTNSFVVALRNREIPKKSCSQGVSRLDLDLP